MPPARQKPIDLLTDEELLALLKVGSRRAPTAVRNRALIATLAYAGLRISEALALAPRDLRLKDGTIAVRHGKGDKERVVALRPEGAPFIESWLNKRQAIGVTAHRALFCTLRGGAVSARYVQLMLRRYAKRAGIAKRVHPHCLRHWHAVHLLQRRAWLPDIQQQLGHSDLATTTHYLDSLAPVDRVRRLRELGQPG